jgi:hypothetical protein
MDRFARFNERLLDALARDNASSSWSPTLLNIISVNGKNITAALQQENAAKFTFNGLLKEEEECK